MLELQPPNRPEGYNRTGERQESAKDYDCARRSCEGLIFTPYQICACSSTGQSDSLLSYRLVVQIHSGALPGNMGASGRTGEGFPPLPSPVRNDKGDKRGKMTEIRTKQEVITRLCALVTEVGVVKYKNSVTYDCFCGANPLGNRKYFAVGEEIIEFIESAVTEKLSKEDE